MKIEKVEYSDLNPEDKVLIQNYNKSCGVLIFMGKWKNFVCWETLNGDEIWDDITHLKEKKTKLIGRICS